jgi:hypothetical protein
VLRQFLLVVTLGKDDPQKPSNPMAVCLIAVEAFGATSKSDY